MPHGFGYLVISSPSDSFQPITYGVALDPSNINGVELNITPGGGLQVGAPRLRRFTARVAIINPQNDVAGRELTRVIQRFEALRGQSVFIDHFLNADASTNWVIEDASPDHDGQRGSGWVFGTLSAVEDISPDASAGLPLGSIVIPTVEADVIEEDEPFDPNFFPFPGPVPPFASNSTSTSSTRKTKERKGDRSTSGAEALGRALDREELERQFDAASQGFQDYMDRGGAVSVIVNGAGEAAEALNEAFSNAIDATGDAFNAGAQFLGRLWRAPTNEEFRRKIEAEQGGELT